VLEELFINNKRDFLMLLSLLEKYYKKHKDDFEIHLKNLFKEYKYYFDISIGDSENQLLREIDKEEPDFWLILNYLKELDEVPSIDSLENHSIEVFVYLNLVRRFFRNAYSYNEPIWWINFLPNMVYRPILKFDRGLTQNGLFFYQAYASYIEEI
jgi:hypothetical protein